MSENSSSRLCRVSNVNLLGRLLRFPSQFRQGKMDSLPFLSASWESVLPSLNNLQHFVTYLTTRRHLISVRFYRVFSRWTLLRTATISITRRTKRIRNKSFPRLSRGSCNLTFWTTFLYRNNQTGFNADISFTIIVIRDW